MVSKKNIDESDEVTEVENDVLGDEDENEDDDESDDDSNSDVTSTDDLSPKQKIEEDEEEEVEEEDDDNIISDVLDDHNEKDITDNIIPSDERMSKPFLNKYEKTRILSTRSKQLSLGAKPLIKIVSENKLTTLDIAKEELKQKMIPYILRRKMPNGKYELWKMEELIDMYQ